MSRFFVYLHDRNPQKMKRPILSAIFLCICITGWTQQQDYKQITDSCLYYLSNSDSSRFNRIYPRLPDAFEQFSDPETHALRQELLTMRNQDQGIRLLLLETRKRCGSENPAAQQIHALMKRIDADNARQVQLLIDKYGWRGKDDIGEEANETLFLCIQHVDDLTVQDKYLPILKQAVEEGRAEGWHYAFLTDRIRMNRGEMQVYGTQTISRNGRLAYVVPLENPDQVDSLRQSVGLETMAVYLDGEWDLEQYKRDLPKIKQEYKAYTASRNAQAK